MGHLWPGKPGKCFGFNSDVWYLTGTQAKHGCSKTRHTMQDLISIDENPSMLTLLDCTNEQQRKGDTEHCITKRDKKECKYNPDCSLNQCKKGKCLKDPEIWG